MSSMMVEHGGTFVEDIYPVIRTCAKKLAERRANVSLRSAGRPRQPYTQRATERILPELIKSTKLTT